MYHIKDSRKEQIKNKLQVSIFNFELYMQKNRRFLTKKAVFLVRVTGLEPAAS